MDTSYHDHQEEEKQLVYISGEELVENIEIVLEEFRVLVTEISNIEVSEKKARDFKSKNEQCVRVFLKLTRLLSELRNHGSLEDTLHEYEILKDKEFKSYEKIVEDKEKEFEDVKVRNNTWSRKVLGNMYVKSIGTVIALGTLGGLVGGPVGGVVAITTGYGSIVGGTVGGVLGAGVGGAIGFSSVTGTKAIKKVGEVRKDRKREKMLEIDITNDIDELTEPPLIFMRKESEEKAKKEPESTITIDKEEEEIKIETTMSEKEKKSGGGLLSFIWGKDDEPIAKTTDPVNETDTSEEETDEDEIRVNSTRISVMDDKYEEVEGEGVQNYMENVKNDEIQKKEEENEEASKSSGGGFFSYIFGGGGGEKKEKKEEEQVKKKE